MNSKHISYIHCKILLLRGYKKSLLKKSVLKEFFIWLNSKIKESNNQSGLAEVGIFPALNNVLKVQLHNLIKHYLYRPFNST
jgi:hypothetical protein